MEKCELTLRLANWLKVNMPNNVLVAVKVDDKGKSPVCRHMGGVYGWDDWDKRWQDWVMVEGRDVMVLLYDLVVIDFDVAEHCEEWEARFVEMQHTTMETTRKGRHYYFMRPLAFGDPKEIEAMTYSAFMKEKHRYVGGVVCWCLGM